MPNDPLSLVITGGAAGALFYVLRLLIEGKLHTNSEVDGLRADIADLKKINASQAEALKASNEQQNQVLRILRSLPIAVFDRQVDE